MVRATLSSLESRLDPQIFLRVHRAALVNIGEIQEVRDVGRLVLDGGMRHHEHLAVVLAQFVHQLEALAEVGWDLVAARLSEMPRDG